MVDIKLFYFWSGNDSAKWYKLHRNIWLGLHRCIHVTWTFDCVRHYLKLNWIECGSGQKVYVFRFFDCGVIKVFVFQIFDKALDEPKYSSMYAQLCKRLSEEAPNFEPPNSPCTFRLLLLNKCRTEFENRSKASEAFEHRDGPLAPEEEERRQLTKRKMLGNIKVCMFLSKYTLPVLHILRISSNKRRQLVKPLWFGSSFVVWQWI